MNRREFLQCFGVALIAAPLVINDEVVDDEYDYLTSDYEPSPPRSYEGIPYIMDFHAVGNADRSMPGLVGMTRSVGRDLFGFPTGTHLFYNWMNAFGGMLRFVPYPGEEIYIPDSYPIEVWSTVPEIKAYGLIRLPGINNFKVLES